MPVIEEEIEEVTVYPKYCCRKCGRQFLNQDDHEIHSFYHESPKKIPEFICEICFKIFHSRSSLEIHVEKHEFNPQCCEICHNEFDNQLKLDGHLLNCHIPLIFMSCEFCGKLCKNTRLLKLHKYLMHEPSRRKEEEITCKICNIKVSFHRGLEHHNRTCHSKVVKKGHDEGRKYKCGSCAEKFRALDEYWAHRVKKHPSTKQVSPHKLSILSK